jgi:hypothetical protein
VKENGSVFMAGPFFVLDLCDIQEPLVIARVSTLCGPKSRKYELGNVSKLSSLGKGKVENFIGDTHVCS